VRGHPRVAARRLRFAEPRADARRAATLSVIDRVKAALGSTVVPSEAGVTDVVRAIERAGSPSGATAARVVIADCGVVPERVLTK
jgi:hypothetical protein